MKRGFAELSAEEPAKRASCTSCKKRKLKCDRASPCSNCVLRKVECLSPERRHTAPSPGFPSEQRNTRNKHSQLEASNNSSESTRNDSGLTPDGTTDAYIGVVSNASISICPNGFGSRYHQLKQSESSAAPLLYNSEYSHRTGYDKRPKSVEPDPIESAAHSKWWSGGEFKHKEFYEARQQRLLSSGVDTNEPHSVTVPRTAPASTRQEQHRPDQYESSTVPSLDDTGDGRNTIQQNSVESSVNEKWWSGDAFKHKEFYNPRQQGQQSTSNDTNKPASQSLPTPESSVGILDALNQIPDGEPQTHDLSRCALSLEADATGMKYTSARTPVDTSSRGTAPTVPGIKLTFPASDAYGQGPITRPEVQRYLPMRSKALRLLDHYADLIQWIYHVCHMPTLRSQLHHLFDTLTTDAPIDMSELALVSAVLGVSAYNFPETPNVQAAEMQALAVELVRLSQRALAEANYLQTPNIATIQADLILGYAIFPETGEMPTTLLALRASIHCAQSLGMHRVDSPRERKMREAKKSDHVKLETMRRIWWRLVSSDWLVSTMSGSFTCTYFIHPDQMQVDLPANVDDDALDSDGFYPRPPSVLTDESTGTLRIGLASVYRAVVDTTNALGLEVHELDYATVQMLDEKFVAYQDNLPYFAKMDPESLARSAVLDKQRPYLVWARAGMHCAYHIRRMQIHRRWLVLGFADARFKRSRDICLESARTVVQVERQMYENTVAAAPKLTRHWAIIHHLLVASLVLAMEYARGNKEMRLEIVECCRALERSSDSSTIAARGLTQLQEVLKKWAANGQQRGEGQVMEDGRPMVDGAGLEVPEASWANMPTGTVAEMPEADAMLGDMFNEMWFDSLNFPTGLEQGEWDALFQEL